MEETKHLEGFLTFIRSSVQKYYMAVDDEAMADLETQDILHRLELSQDDYHKTAKLAKALRQIRQKRREAKQTIELLDPIVKWQNENKSTLKGIERLLGSIRIIDEKQSKRTYTPRTDILNEVIEE